MSRIYRKPLSSILANNKRLKQKAALSIEMLYCKKCGWGWESAEKDICPHCGAKQSE